MLTQTTTTTQTPFIPVVVISSLRPQYLQLTLESLKNQHEDTPHWILHSLRYLFVHQHELLPNATQNAVTVRQLARDYGFQVHTFHDLYDPNAAMNVNANAAWYQMLSYLFFESHLGVSEALIVEEDTPLAPDALHMTAAMLQHKWKVTGQKGNNNQQNASSATTTTIHGCALGGWSGENRINAHTQTFLAVHPQFWHSMAYTLDGQTFAQIMRRKATRQHVKREEVVGDWAMEMVIKGYVTNLTQLTPSVGRMRHAGQVGLGESGEGGTWDLHNMTPWEPWNEELADPLQRRSSHYYYLDPPQITDVFGFICDPPQWNCGGAEVAFPRELRMGATHNISRSVVPSSQQQAPTTTEKTTPKKNVPSSQQEAPTTTDKTTTKKSENLFFLRQNQAQNAKKLRKNKYKQKRRHT